ncbi:MAG: sodium:solute symporter family protein [Bacteroidota bacterium]
MFRSFAVLSFLLGATIVYLYLTQAAQVNWPAFGFMVLFYVLIYGVGAYAAKRKAEAESDVDGFMLAGRSMPLALAFITMSATWLGGGFINGTAESIVTNGLIWVQAPWGYALSLIVGGIFFAGIMRRRGYRTMLDPLAERYGDRLTAVLFLPALTGELFWTAAILTALGANFSAVLGIDLTTAILLSAGVAIAYTALGGLWAVAMTDILQLAIILVGLGLMVIPIVSHTGGWSATWSAYVAEYGNKATIFPSMAALGDQYWSWWDSALLLIFGGIPWQVYFQRVLAAKDERTAVWMSIIAGGVCCVAILAPAAIGISASVVDWAAIGSTPPPSAAATLPWALRELTPPWMAAVALGAIAGAVMSSVDSSVLSASSMSIWNVYRPLVRPQLPDQQIAKLIQRSVWILGITATLIAFQVQSVYALWYLCSDFVYCLLFPALVCALFDPRSNAQGALAGFLVAAFLRFGGGDPTLGLPAFLPYPAYFPFRTLAMISGLFAIIFGSRIISKETSK